MSAGAEAAPPAEEGQRQQLQPSSKGGNNGSGPGNHNPVSRGDEQHSQVALLDEPDERISVADRSLPERTLRAYYGVSDSELSGPTAFGERSTVIGVVNQFSPGRADEKFHTDLIPVAVLKETCAVYERTETDNMLGDRLLQRHVVYLSGQPGTGRLTAAQVAVAARHAPDRVAEIALAPYARLADVVRDPRLLREGHGHVLVLHDESAVGMSLLATLEGHAEAQQATIVVIGNSGKNDPEVSRYLVRHAGPAPLDVFAIWLEHRLHEYSKCVEKCAECRADCIDRYVRSCREELGAQLNAIRRIDGAAHRATEFARLTPRGAEAKRLLLRERVGLVAQAEDLLRPKPLASGYRGRRATQHQQAFRLAYAVLDGHPLSRVFHATGVLVDQLDDALRRPRAGRSVLELDVDTLLGEDMAVESFAHVSDELVGTARVAQLRHPELAGALLDVVWNEYDSARGPILEWLKALVATGQAWVPAAAVAGRLCAHDYNQVHGELISKWAVSPRALDRQAAALACESAAHNRHLTTRILRGVREWVLDPSPRLHDAAARVYATRLFAQRFADYALADLKVIARDPMQRRSDSVPFTIQQVYRTDSAHAVMATIIEWATSDLPQLPGIADRCLVTLAQQHADKPGSRMPLLLGHVYDGIVPLSDLARLWPSALRQPMTSNAAWTALHDWISSAEDEPEIVTVLRNLVALIIVDRPLRMRADFYLNQVWRRRMPTNPFLDVLDTLLRD